MREFTKSVSSFFWAMSLFGLQQTVNLLSPSKAAKAFDSATKASEDQFSGVLKTTFNAGDRLQRSAVDMTLGMFTGETLNPNRWMRMASDTARQSAEVVSQGMQGVTSTVRQAASTATSQSAGAGNETETATGSASTDSHRQGWGAMPS